MKKHIIGFTLFSIIVGTAAFIYAMFNVVKVEEVFVPAYTPTYQRNSCWKMKRDFKESNVGSSIIKQAVFNLKTKQFSWELVTQRIDSPIVLHFFIKNEKGTRYIGTEQDTSSVRYGELNFSSSFIWIDNLDSYENLYVIAEVAPVPGYYKKHQPKFDVNKATAISLDYGK